MPHTAANYLDAPSFVPPEPYEKPSLLRPPQQPRWLRVAISIAFIALEILALWLSTRK